MLSIETVIAAAVVAFLSFPQVQAHRQRDDLSTSMSPNLGSFFKTLRLPYYPPNADCTDYEIPLSMIWDKYEFNATRWTNDYELADFFTVATTREPGPNYPAALSATPTKVNGTYTVAATFCTPKQQTEKAKTIVFATHGIAPARSHWNPGFKPEQYNFAQHAIGEGYSVFMYDRLGCGASQKLSGFEANLFTAISAIENLVPLVRSGKYTGILGAPSKIAVIGFSFGSYATHGAIAQTPSLADAVILTAIGFNETGINVNGLLRSYEPRIAALQIPTIYGDRDAGYITWRDGVAQVWNYFRAPNYEPSAIEFAEAAKEPFAVAEFLTLLMGPKDASGFTGPALHITGKLDYIFGDGYVPGIFEEPGRTYYRNAKLQQVLQPGDSHNWGLHRNASAGFKVVTDFLGSNGL